MVRQTAETQLSRQAQIAIQVDAADRTKRIAASALFTVMLWWQVHLAVLVCFALTIIVFETWFEWIRRATPPADEPVSERLALHHLIHGTVGIFVYTSPAVIFSYLPGQSNVACALFWATGIAIHITNRYVMLSYYFWTKNAGIFLVFVIILFNFSQAELTPSSTLDWVVTSLFLIAMFSNTLETLNQNADTRAALAAAQDKAASRLKELEHIMRHDPMTGLLRRSAFDEELEKLIAAPRAEGQSLAFLLIDLDGFKPINDTYGHSAGDHLLKVIGLRLLARFNTLSARLGGDEFGVALDPVESPEHAMDLALQIWNDLTQPVEWDGKTLSVGASIGVNLYSERCCEIETLCAGADQAMYHAKSTGSERVVLFDPDLFNPRLNLIDRQIILDAMAASEFRPYYQPKVDLATRAIVGFETLARWPNPAGGPVRMPGEFLPQIAELQLQSEFTSYMSQQVVADVALLLSRGIDPGQVSINLPEVSLATKSGLDDLIWILSEQPQTIKHITFEITEDVLIARAGDIIRDSIDRLYALGARISLDDFGTGFASFQHLRQLTFDELKIDTSFVAGLGKDTVSDVIVDGFLSIARGLGVDAVAEGVETEEQATHLSILGCQYGQGYLFGRAMPLEDVLSLFAPDLRSTGT